MTRVPFRPIFAKIRLKILLGTTSPAGRFAVLTLVFAAVVPALAQAGECPLWLPQCAAVHQMAALPASGTLESTGDGGNWPADRLAENRRSGSAALSAISVVV